MATFFVNLRVSGPEFSQRIQKTLGLDQKLRFGRAPKDGLAVPWDLKISREHADMFWDGRFLTVICTEKATNPIVYHGEKVRKAEISLGDGFRIGSTVFLVVENIMNALDRFDCLEELGTIVDEIPPSSLEGVSSDIASSESQMELLAKLPYILSKSKTDEDLAEKVCSLLLNAIPQAEGVAVASVEEAVVADGGPNPSGEGNFETVMFRLDKREDFSGSFRPSKKMIERSIERQQSSIETSFERIASDESSLGESGAHWILVSPVTGESECDWCLYVSGTRTREFENLLGEEDLQGDLQFVDLVAQYIGSIRDVRNLQEQNSQMSTFFSPSVIEEVKGKSSSSSLTPTERTISVLFCDVRDFSKKSEKYRNDLHTLLESVSEALGVMAKAILSRDGTIADFQGDAALGFWGWPNELEEGPIPACRAALSMFNEIKLESQRKGSSLRGFAVGLGIAHGRALAGQVGTSRQAKVGVFGPTVNQCARLEGLTKHLGVPICIDEETALYVKRLLDPSEGRVRWLARLRPAGMDDPVNVFALLPPFDEELGTCDLSRHDTGFVAPFFQASDEMIDTHEQAVELIIKSRWDEARELLVTFPTEDRPSQFLLEKMAQFDNTVPSDWEGVFLMQDK